MDKRIISCYYFQISLIFYLTFSYIFHINLFTFMPQSWVLILLIKNRKKKKRRSWMLISILLLCTGTKNSVDCVDDSVVDINALI